MVWDREVVAWWCGIEKWWRGRSGGVVVWDREVVAWWCGIEKWWRGGVAKRSGGVGEVVVWQREVVAWEKWWCGKEKWWRGWIISGVRKKLIECRKRWLKNG